MKSYDAFAAYEETRVPTSDFDLEGNTASQFAKLDVNSAPSARDRLKMCLELKQICSPPPKPQATNHCIRRAGGRGEEAESESYKSYRTESPELARKKGGVSTLQVKHSGSFPVVFRVPSNLHNHRDKDYSNGRLHTASP